MNEGIAAMVLAAGQSRRMGTPKMALPWGERTVIGQVLYVLEEARIDDIYVVTGGAEEIVRQAIQPHNVRLVHNEKFATGEMISSVQAGLAVAQSGNWQAALIVLGDQPQIKIDVVFKLRQAWQAEKGEIIIPSYQMRRGHPWLLARCMWQEVIELHPTQTLRDFLNRKSDRIVFLPVETNSILQDLDTPDDYLRQSPGQNPGQSPGQ